MPGLTDYILLGPWRPAFLKKGNRRRVDGWGKGEVGEGTKRTVGGTIVRICIREE